MSSTPSYTEAARILARIFIARDEATKEHYHREVEKINDIMLMLRTVIGNDLTLLIGAAAHEYARRIKDEEGIF